MSTMSHVDLPPSAAGEQPGGPDALRLLKSDHESVESLFKQYEQLGSDRIHADRSGLAVRFCGQLDAHAQIEERLFYPALRKAGAAAELLDRAADDHAGVTRLIAEVSALQPGDTAFDAKVRELMVLVRRHVRTEEASVFPAARSAGIDLLALGAQMAQLRAQVMPVQGPD